MEEIWKDIEGYDGYYQISNFGEVISYKLKEHSYLSLCLGSSGYLQTSLSKNGKRKAYCIHTLVWDNFSDVPRNGRKLQVDHIDNNKQNNRIDNLQLVTPSENCSKSKLIKQKTSKYSGVHWNSKNKKWQAYFGKKYLGSFENEKNAYLKYLDYKSNL